MAKIITNPEQTHLLVDAGSHYKKIMVKGIENFNALVTQMEYDYNIDFCGMDLEFEDVDLLFDGYCAINNETPLQALRENPNDEFFHLGHFMYNEQKNIPEENVHGTELRVNKTLLVSNLQNLYGLKIAIGSMPYLRGDSVYDCTQYMGFYENNAFSGTIYELHEWAANL